MKTIKIILSILAVAAGALVFSGCDKYFEVDTYSDINREKILDTESTYTGIWAFMYRGLENGYAQISNTMIACACDEADNNQPFSAIQRFNTGSWNGITNPDGVSWANLYGYIRQANLLLEVSDTTVNPVLTYSDYKISDPDKYDRLRAEWYAYQIDADFFKAFYHFEAWKRFGLVPIVDKLLTEDEARALPQAVAAEMIAYIERLIEGILPKYDILAGMPATPYLTGAGGGDWSLANKGRITKGAALALLCRAYLYAASPLHNGGLYDKALCDKAARTAAQIIRLGQYSTAGTNYRNLFLSPDNNECIVDSRVAVYYPAAGYSGGANGTNYQEFWNYPRVGGGTLYEDPYVGGNAVCPSQNLVDAYRTATGYVADLATLPADLGSVIVDGRFATSIVCPGTLFNGFPIDISPGGHAERNTTNSTTTGYFLKKFIQESMNLNTSQVARHAWYLFRYGEVLLNYAEASFNGNLGAAGDYDAGITAADALNLLHARPYDTSGSPVLDASYDFTDAALTNEMIRRERQVELAFEGHRFWDVRRWQIAETTENAPLGGVDLASSSATSFTRVTVEERVFIAPRMYFYPIPQEDISNYPSWTNNGW